MATFAAYVQGGSLFRTDNVVCLASGAYLDCCTA